MKQDHQRLNQPQSSRPDEPQKGSETSISPLFQHLTEIAHHEEIQEVIKLLEDIRLFQDHPEMIVAFKEHDHELAHGTRRGTNILDLLIEDYLMKTSLDMSDDLRRQDLEAHVKFRVITALKGYQKAVENIRKEVGSSVRYSEDRNSGVRSSQPEMPLLPIPHMPKFSSRPSRRSRATIPAAPAPHSVRGRKRETMPFIPSQEHVWVEDVSETSNESSLEPRKVPYVFKNKACTVPNGSLTSIVYAMPGSTITVEDGAKLDLYMISDGVTIVLEGDHSLVKIDRATRNCNSIRILGKSGESLVDSHNAELGKGIAEKLSN